MDIRGRAIAAYLPYKDLISLGAVNKQCLELARDAIALHGMRKSEFLFLNDLFYKYYHDIAEYIEKRKIVTGIEENGVITRYWHHLGNRFFYKLFTVEDAFIRAERLRFNIPVKPTNLRSIHAEWKKNGVSSELLDVILRSCSPHWRKIRTAWYFHWDLLKLFTFFFERSVCQVCLHSRKKTRPRCTNCLSPYCRNPHFVSQVCDDCTETVLKYQKMRRDLEIKRREAISHIRYHWGVCTRMDPSCESYSHAGQGCRCRCHGTFWADDSDAESVDSLSSDDDLYGF